MLVFGLLFRSHLTLINLEEVIRFCGMLAGYIVESCSRDVVGLALFDKTVVLKEVLLL